MPKQEHQPEILDRKRGWVRPFSLHRWRMTSLSALQLRTLAARLASFILASCLSLIALYELDVSALILMFGSN